MSSITRMSSITSSLIFACSLVAWCMTMAPRAWSADPTAEQALKLAPIQKNVDYDRPTAAEVAKCTIKAEKTGKTTGWAVFGPGGERLRRFLDSNGDGTVDRWCYYKNGIEVYRDIDGNFNRKADQFRWFSTAGSRWGLAPKEDGNITIWKVISAQEATQQVVAAIRGKDQTRFAALLLTAGELKSLGLGAKKRAAVAKKLSAAPAAFEKLAKSQKTVTKTTRWAHFGGTRPGVVPAGTDGSTRDLTVYENVVATVESQGRHAQVYVGTIIRVADRWRLIDVPLVLTGTTGELANTGFFFRAPLVRSSEQVGSSDGLDDKLRELLAQLEQLDTRLSKATSPDATGKIHSQRTRLLLKIAAGSKDAQARSQWIRQLADTASVAIQSGAYPDGLADLKALLSQLKKAKADTALVSYVVFRSLNAAYGLSLQNPDADYSNIQQQWIKTLKKYVADYPATSDTPEAMLQLAIAEEFAGDEKVANASYSAIVTRFPKSDAAKKAAGARRRLGSVGKTIKLHGTSTTGKKVALAAYRGRVVLVQYWATWCEPCKDDMKKIQKLVTKYGRRGFYAIGVNFDTSRSDVERYVANEKLSWLQIHEPGGLENRLANEMGILTLPTMILVGKDGKVLSRNIHISEIEAALKKQFSTAKATRPKTSRKR